MRPGILPEQFELGGHAAWWQWDTDLGATASVPSGLLIQHTEPEAHLLEVRWCGASGAGFTLDSLLPLTVVERLTCPVCQVSGRIDRGEWQPAEGGADRG